MQYARLSEYRSIVLVRTAWLLLAVTALLSSCSAFSSVEEVIAADLRPPQLQHVRTLSTRSFELLFDEPARITAEAALLSPGRGEITTVSEKNVVTVRSEQEMTPGVCYLFEAVAADSHGNCLSFMSPVYGHNSDPAALRINEFITNGTTTHPDLVELAVVKAGNLAGLCLSVGTPGDWDSRIVLPNRTVETGEFVLVHCKPSGDASEIDELADRAASGGADSSPLAWDYWIPQGTGLSGNNGVLTLASSPGGAVADAVIYSNRTSDSDDRYRGFGSTRMMDWVDEIVAAGAWSTSGELAAPEDAVDPSDSTSTRSICRSSETADTDSRADWHTVPTRGSTFGAVNSDEVYVP